MSTRAQSAPTQEDLAIWQRIRSNACPIFWTTDVGNPLSFIDNGTMFAVRFGFETYCLTAKHVTDDYVSARNKGAFLCLGSGMKGQLVFGSRIEEVLHDSDPLLDITVLKLNSLPLGLDVITLHDSTPRPRKGLKGYLVGYPTRHIRRSRYEFDCLQLLSAFTIENVWNDKATIRTLVSEVETYGTDDIVDYTIGLAGCSGGPVFQEIPGLGVVPVGIYTHIGSDSSAADPSERIMEITPLSKLRRDGTLKKSY